MTQNVQYPRVHIRVRSDHVSAAVASLAMTLEINLQLINQLKLNKVHLDADARSELVFRRRDGRKVYHYVYLTYIMFSLQ